MARLTTCLADGWFMITDSVLIHPCHVVQGDGGKAMCSMSNLHPPCLVYSLGSNGDVSFEKDVLQHTPCNIHTFDCTVNAIAIEDPTRHTFHQLCIGDPSDSSEKLQFEPLDSIMRRLNHTRLHVLKMDIEGSEYEVSSPPRAVFVHMLIFKCICVNSVCCHVFESSMGHHASHEQIMP
jgi:hypothetical protein